MRTDLALVRHPGSPWTQQLVGALSLSLGLSIAPGAWAAGGGYWLRLDDVRQAKPKADDAAKPKDTEATPVPLPPAASSPDAPAPTMRWEHRSAVTTSASSGDRNLNPLRGLGVLTLSSRGKARSDNSQWVWNASAALQTRSDADSPYRGGQIRELNWQTALSPSVDLRLGRLMPAWGRADGLNPTDNLTPRDYRQLGTEMDDMRYGNEGAQLSWALPGGSDTLSGWAFPRSASNQLALPLPASISLRQVGAERQGLWALKWDHSGEGLDASLSYLDGSDLMPDLRLASLTQTGALVTVSNARQRVLGADVSVQDGPRIWRAEAAWTQPTAPGIAPAKRPSVWMVGGPEWTHTAWTVGVQGVWQQVSGWQSPDSEPAGVMRDIARLQASIANQTAPRQRGLTLRLAHRAVNDTLQSELSVLALWPQGGHDGGAQGMMRGKIDYALNDQWGLKSGFDAPFGPSRSLFGLWRDNRLVYVQVRRSL